MNQNRFTEFENPASTSRAYPAKPMLLVGPEGLEEVEGTREVARSAVDEIAG